MPTSVSIALGIVLLVMAFFLYTDDTRNKNWPTIDGTITNVNLARVDSMGPGNEVQLSYRYVINGQVFTKNAVCIGRLWTMDGAQNRRRKFKIGHDIKVHYNPENYSSSSVEAQLESHQFTFYSMIILGAFLVLMGIGERKGKIKSILV